MERKEAEKLYDNYLEGTCTRKEKILFEKWYNQFIRENDDDDEPRKNLEYQRREIAKRLSVALIKKINWPLNILLTAAAIAIIGTAATLLFKKAEPAPTRFATDINPGGNRAILTLQNGKTIQLSVAKSGIIIDASKLTYNDGTLINNEQTQAFTISTPRGGTYQVQLPDGSNVWLNASSSLTYNSALKGQEQYRSVKLSGEAYFEVAKDKTRPFVVTTDKQRIEVLGTHFNVSAYNDDLSVSTTLLEGSVKVAPLTTTGERKEIILTPNQQSEIDANGITVHAVYADDVIDWKNGSFSFASESLESIMKKISRWYDVEVVYADKQIGNKPFSGAISKYEKVSQVLCLLEATGEVKFKINGRRITVMH